MVRALIRALEREVGNEGDGAVRVLSVLANLLRNGS
jgi:hypothetical protein